MAWRAWLHTLAIGLGMIWGAVGGELGTVLLMLTMVGEVGLMAWLGLVENITLDATVGERVMTSGVLMGAAAGRASAGSAAPRVGVRMMLSGPDW